MKVTLEFKLPEEKSEHLLALRGPEYFRALRALDEALRKALKYDYLLDKSGNNIAVSDKDKEILQTIRDLLIDETITEGLLDEIE